MNSPLQSALRLAGEGLFLFPLQRGGKKPLFAGWTETATRNPELLARWAQKYPDCNWGILCGRQSGIWVLDADHKHGVDGMATLRQHWDIDWARTFTVRTPHHGVQFYYAWNDDLGEIRNANPLLPGIDIRGQNGYVVAPGSVLTYCDIPNCPCHPSEYTVVANRAFNDNVKARQFVFKHRSAMAAPKSASSGKFSLGKRNPALFKMALAMHQAHMAPEVIGEAVLRENREHCDPPKTEREVIELVNRVLEYHVPPTVTVGANPDGLDEKLQTVEQALANTPKELEWLVENLFSYPIHSGHCGHD